MNEEEEKEELERLESIYGAAFNPAPIVESDDFYLNGLLEALESPAKVVIFRRSRVRTLHSQPAPIDLRNVITKALFWGWIIFPFACGLLLWLLKIFSPKG